MCCLRLPCRWVWSEAGQQPDLEEALGLGGFGYPALAVFSPKKLKYSILRGSFGFDGINEFLRDLSYGRGSTFPVKGAQVRTPDTTVSERISSIIFSIFISAPFHSIGFSFVAATRARAP